MDREPYTPVLDTVQFELQGKHDLVLLLFFLGLLFLLLVVIPGAFLLLFLGFLHQFELLLAQFGAVERILREVGTIDVHLASPARVVLHSIATAVSDHGLAVHHPRGSPVTISASAQVDHLLLTGSVHQSGLTDPLIRLQEIGKQPLAVRGPLIILVTVAITVVAVPGKDRSHLL